MGLDVGKVTIEYLPRPSEDSTYEFARQLACEASCVGEGNAFGFYLRGDMQERAKDYAREFVDQTIEAGHEAHEARDTAIERVTKELMDWIASLPWDEDGYLTLTFNW